jgi:ATP-dependent helicase/DNAse subunit B
MGAMQKGERRQLLEDRVLFYQSITNFSRQLFLCWPEHSLNGSDLSRSIFLDALEDIVEMEREEPVNGIYSYRDLYLKSAEIGSQLFASERSPLPFYVRTLQEFVPRALASQSSRGGEGTPIYRGTVEPLLLTEQERAVLEKNQSCVWSVTQLEMYANCPLGEPSEDEDGLDARERGSVLHEVLREFLTSRRERKLPAIQDLSEAELPEVYEDARKIANRRMDMVASDHPFWKLDAERLLPKKKEGSVLWKFIARERALAPFHPRPEFFEVSFGGAGGKTGRVTERDDRLSRDEPVVIGGVAFRGQIDRIDVSDETFTIVDYKSGARTPTRAEIDRGLSLQLPLYLRVAEDLLRSHLPELTGVAALYHKVLEPESERKLGLAVRSYIQKSFEAVGGKKSGGYVETEEDLQNVIEATIAKARAYVEGISRGEFRLTQRDLVRNCEYCPYGAVCRVQEAIELDSLTKENA